MIEASQNLAITDSNTQLLPFQSQQGNVQNKQLTEIKTMLPSLRLGDTSNLNFKIKHFSKSVFFAMSMVNSSCHSFSDMLQSSYHTFQWELRSMYDAGR